MMAEMMTQMMIFVRLSQTNCFSFSQRPVWFQAIVDLLEQVFYYDHHCCSCCFLCYSCWFFLLVCCSSGFVCCFLLNCLLFLLICLLLVVDSGQCAYYCCFWNWMKGLLLRKGLHIRKGRGKSRCQSGCTTQYRSLLEAVYSHSLILNPSLRMYQELHPNQ